MIRVCSWCKRFMGVKRPWLDLHTTHGICPKCAWIFQLGMREGECLAQKGGETSGQNEEQQEQEGRQEELTSGSTGGAGLKGNSFRLPRHEAIPLGGHAGFIHRLIGGGDLTAIIIRIKARWHRSAVMSPSLGAAGEGEQKKERRDGRH